MLSKPTIAILHYSSFPIIGGVETIIQAHARLFADNGYSVKLIVGEGEPFDSRIPVRVIPKMRSLHQVDESLNQELEKGKAGRRFETVRDDLYKELKEELASVDIVIIHNLLTMHFNLPLTAALVKIFEEKPAGPETKKFIAWCHDATFKDLHYAHYWRDKYPWQLLSRAFPQVDYVAISQLRQQELAKLFKLEQEEITVVPDGVDPSLFLNLSPLSLSIFKDFNLFDEDFVFFYPTRIVRRKNIELAIRITKAINVEGKKVSLIITSPPDPHNEDSLRYYQSLKNLAEELGVGDKVIFLYEYKDEQGKGIRVDEQLLRDLYLLSDLLLFPTSSEGFGIPILEAGICNLPVACSRIEPLTEIGGEEVLYLNLDDSPEKMARDIINHLAQHLTLPLFKKVFRRYTWPAIFSRNIESLLQK
ncbi:MAG: glycosyltransferase family 4 protein [Nitrospirae bacterium]|nr:glycosyltransferase family 4 protein [Nitrospirota bacterium]